MAMTRLRRVRYGKSRPVREERRVGALDDPLVATEQKYSVLLEYAKASFERIEQRLRHL